MISAHFDSRFKFASAFNTENGEYYRSNVVGEDGLSTSEDPFRGSMPELIDIGIMGYCEAGRNGICKAGCYQGGAGNEKPHMTLADYTKIMDEVSGHVYQVALGGHGDPNQHPDFVQILEASRAADIVPNYTTSGYNLTNEQIAATKKNCGAVAVSWERGIHSIEAIRRFVSAGCTTSVHFVLSNKSIDEAIRMLQQPQDFPEIDGIYAIIFLLHKPVGCGSKQDMLNMEDPRLAKFFDLITAKLPFKIGFDSCSVPAIINHTDRIDPDSIDTCEGSRFSCYISSDMVMVPCSFDQPRKYGVSLNDNTVRQAWESPQFEMFRSHLTGSCPECPSRKVCMGGCPLQPAIVLCDRVERSQSAAA